MIVEKDLFILFSITRNINFILSHNFFANNQGQILSTNLIPFFELVNRQHIYNSQRLFDTTSGIFYFE